MTRKKILILLGSVFLALVMVVMACAAPAPTPTPAPTPAPTPTPTPTPSPPPAQKVYTLQLQGWSPAGTKNFELMVEDAEFLKTMTDGRIELTILPAGAITGYNETLEALGAGLLDMALQAAAWYGGMEPGLSVIWNLPGIWEDPRQVKIWYESWGGIELHASMYKPFNVHFIGQAGRADEPLMGNVPMSSLDDFKGKKVRTGAGLSWDLFKILGAVPVEMDGGEVYTALDTGLVDIAEFTTAATNYDLGLHEVSKYILSPGITSPTGNNDISINMDLWNELPDDLKAIIEAWVRNVGARQDYIMSGEDIRALKAMQEYGLELSTLSSEDLSTLREISFGLLDPWKEKSPMAKAVLESVLDFLAAQGKI